MDRRSKQLCSEERRVILAEPNRGSSQQVIGALLGRPASTISWDLTRGRQDDGSFRASVARSVYDDRRVRCRRKRKLAEGE